MNVSSTETEEQYYREKLEKNYAQSRSFYRERLFARTALVAGVGLMAFFVVVEAVPILGLLGLVSTAASAAVLWNLPRRMKKLDRIGDVIHEELAHAEHSHSDLP